MAPLLSPFPRTLSHARRFHGAHTLKEPRDTRELACSHLHLTNSLPQGKSKPFSSETQQVRMQKTISNTVSIYFEVKSGFKKEEGLISIPPPFLFLVSTRCDFAAHNGRTLYSGSALKKQLQRWI